jgi:hypothetical protein
MGPLRAKRARHPLLPRWVGTCRRVPSPACVIASMAIHTSSAARRPNHPTPSNNAITGAARRLVTPTKRQNDSMGDQERVCETKSLVFYDFAIIWGERRRRG